MKVCIAGYIHGDMEYLLVFYADTQFCGLCRYYIYLTKVVSLRPVTVKSITDLRKSFVLNISVVYVMEMCIYVYIMSNLH